MKFLQKQLDKIRPNFQKGGKFYWLHSTFDATETFLFVPGETTHNGAHIRDGVDLKRTMFTVIIAMLPVLLFGLWNTGYQHFVALGKADTASLLDCFGFGLVQVLPIIIVSYAVGLGIEFFFCQIKGHKVNEGFLVTGMLIPLCLPPTIPLWMVAVGTAFAVIIGKEVFGGTGMNLLNPALTARVFLFFAYPAYMAGEYRADQEYIWYTANRADVADGFSGATILARAAEGKELGFSAWDAFIGTIPGSVGETSTLACLIGAAILIITGVGSWRIMLSTFAGGAAMGLLLNVLTPSPTHFMAMPFYYHLVIGGFAFGAIYMATDPVSAAQTDRGKLIYGFLIGIICVLIRVFNPAYPEGMMLAILLMNIFAPLIDYFVVNANKKGD
ncbi:NADH:ubiquinone reductase (Na(+)-transporting) subunit B [Oscillatoria amoena NRMC-F 0135]|nr:NADH:ubiquinone reductase (Na(+)-transporting) subunit B [Oscillatoria amoena NRMC-F 0135]